MTNKHMSLLYKGKCPSCRQSRIIKQIDNGSVSALFERIDNQWINVDNNPTQDTLSTIYYCENCNYERIIDREDA